MLFFYIFEQWVLTWTQAEMFLCMELEATGKTYKNKELTFLWTPTKKKPGFPPEVKKKFSLLKCSYNIFVAADGYPFPLSSQQWVSSSRKTLAAVFLIVLMYLSLSLVHNLHGEGPLPFLPCEWCFPSGVFWKVKLCVLSGAAYNKCRELLPSSKLNNPCRPVQASQAHS